MSLNALFFALIKQNCEALNIQFHLLHGSAGEAIPGFVCDRGLGAVVTDFSPLREQLQWLEDVEKKLPEDIPLIQVKQKLKRFHIFDCFPAFECPILSDFTSTATLPVQS